MLKSTSRLCDVKVVIFDWGGVLGHSGKRHVFLYSPSIKQRKSALKRDVFTTLKTLKSRGYILGILSNTKYSRADMSNALKKLKLDKYFKFAIYSSDDFTKDNGPKMCRKPCRNIFETAIKISREYIPYIRASRILYVGDDYRKDMVGAKKLGFKTAFLIGDDYTNLQRSQSRPLNSHDIVLSDLSDILSFLK